MDQTRFDSLARSLATTKTRRGLLGGLAALIVGVRAASAQEASCPLAGQTRNRKGDCLCPAGTDPCPDGCFDLKRSSERCGSCNRSCAGGECRKGRCTCPGGATPDPTLGCPVVCGGTVCAPDQDACLANGSCARSCGDGVGCPDGCACSFPSVDGPSRCIGTESPAGQACVVTTDCPTGEQCQQTLNAEDQCVQLCTAG